MSLESWRQFQFFETLPITDPFYGSDEPSYSDPTLSAATFVADRELAIAVHSNVIKLVSIEKTSIVHKFQAFDDDYQITYMKVIGNEFLVTVGECLGKPCEVHIYKLKNLPNGPKSYHSLVEIKNGDNTSPISGVSVSSDLTCLVIGFANGKIVLVRGDLPRDRGSRQRVIYEDSDNEPITSLFLNNDASLCYVSTTTKIMLFTTSGRNYGQPDLILNPNEGVSLHCACYNQFSDEYVCSLKNSVTIYRSTGESVSFNYSGPQVKRIFSYSARHFLLITDTDVFNNTALNMENLMISSSVKLMIFDSHDKILAYNKFITANVVDVLASNDFKSIYLLTSEGVLHELIQKSQQEQINTVIQKEMFSYALDLAKQFSFDDINVQELHKKYGDYLFDKNQIAEATKEYVQSIDVVETSEIISKLGVNDKSSGPSIKELSEYLWSLQKCGKANADHITLLLIILIKLKEENEINDFIKNFSRSGIYSSTGSDKDLSDEEYFYSDKTLFDLNLILDLLVTSNYLIEAYKMANKFTKDPSQVVEILLNKLNNPIATLEYIKTLTVDDILRVLVIYSKQLLEKIPNDTNLLLIEVFTGNFKPEKNLELDLSPVTENTLNAEMKKVFYSYASFLGYKPEVKSGNATDGEDKLKSTYHPPKPSLIFNSFISKPFQFVVFLEACLDTYQKYGGLDDDKQTIYTTLYDLYLTLYKEDVEERRFEWKQKAAAILKQSNDLASDTDSISKNSSKYNQQSDNSLMLLISNMNGIDIHMLSDNLSATNIDVSKTFQSLISQDKPKVCLEFISKHGDENPSLFKAALEYFLSSDQIFKEIGGEDVLRKEVLDKIYQNQILSMNEIIQILSKTNVATFGLIQDVFVEFIEEQDSELQKTSLLIESYEAELEQKKKQLQTLSKKDEQVSIQIKNKSCPICNTELELPIVFFKCTHAYHQKCLNEEANKETGTLTYVCPKCVLNLESSEKLVKLQQSTSNNSNMLKAAFDNQPDQDKFKVITDFIARGGLDYPTTIT